MMEVTASYNGYAKGTDDSHKSSASLYSASLMPEVPSDNEIARSIRSPNEKQQMFFNVKQNWPVHFI